MSNFAGYKVNKFLIGILVLIVIGILFYTRDNLSSAITTQNAINQDSSKEITELSPTPLPFQEMTIPYLREQTYVSTLGDRAVAYQRADYTAFLTSYTSEGLKINALLTEPKTEKPASGWPAIIFIHGYIPPRQYATQQQYSEYVDYLARNGFAVLKIDLRGHGQSEGEAGGGYYGADYVTDTLNAYAALQSAWDINRNAIGLWGHSMAGNIVLRSVAAQQDIPAAVIWAGAVYTYTDLKEYGIQDSSYVAPAPSSATISKRQKLIQTVGEVSAENVFWKQVAATNYLKDIKTAINIHHAVDDPVVKIEYSRNLDKILEDNKVSHTLFEYPSGGHNFNGASFNQAMQKTVDFFKIELK